MLSKRTVLFAIAFVPFWLQLTEPAVAQTWIGTWAASPDAQNPQVPGTMPSTFSNQTVRQVVHVSLGGSKVRIRLSNEFGSHPVKIGAASIALSGTSPQLATGSLRPVTFGGSKSITLRPGTPAISDSVELNVPSLSDVAVSLYLPDQTNVETVHPIGSQTAYTSTVGDFTSTSDFPAAGRFNGRVWLSSVMVEANASARVVAAFGASITDGFRSTVNSNSRWPDFLARRFNESGQSIAVLNDGLSGNRVLSDNVGLSALARFERDVLSQPGLSHVIIAMGNNDFGIPGTRFDPAGTVPTTEEMIAGYKQLIERAHTRSVKVIGATLTPFENANLQAYFSPEKDAGRQAINAWIRTRGAFDGIVDFDRAIADPARPTRIAPSYDSGDHLHPNDAGYRTLAELIDLNLLR